VTLEWFFDKILGKLVLPLRVPGRYLVRLKRQYRIKRFEREGVRAIEIGGGRYPIASRNINLDGLDAPEVDVVHRFPEPMPFPENYVGEIVTVATLEHFNVHDIRKLLVDFLRVLRPGGKLVIAVPVLEKVMKRCEEDGCTDEVLMYLHGGQKDENDVHLSVLTTERWYREIKSVGFTDVASEGYDLSLHDERYMGKIVARKPSVEPQ
jgi:SAM-dependent methyltransferase